MADAAADGAEDSSIQSALRTLRGLLTDGEVLEAWAVQHRLYALTHRRTLIAATSGRFIALSRRLLGGYDSEDIRWQDLKETQIRAGILAADLTVIAQSSADLSIAAAVNRVWTFNGLRKDQAQAIYRICQQHDQIWREKRRIRELEEMRAKSGALQLQGAGALYGAVPSDAAAGGAATGAAAESEPARRLRQAREMLDAKLITDSEYESIKAKIVSSL